MNQLNDEKNELPQGVTELDVPTCKKRLDTCSETLLIDVRQPEEWNECHIPEANHIPLAQLEEKITAACPDKNRPIMLHCRRGGRSLRGALKLAELGYTNLISMKGGMLDWKERDYPTV